MSLRVNPERLVGRPLLKRPIMTAVAAILNPLIRNHTALQVAPYEILDEQPGFIDKIPGWVSYKVTARLAAFKVIREAANPDKEYNEDKDIVYIGLKFRITDKKGKTFKISDSIFDSDVGNWPTFFLDGVRGFLDKSALEVAHYLWSNSGVFEECSLGFGHPHPQNKAFFRLVSGKNWEVIYFESPHKSQAAPGNSRRVIV